MNKFSPKRELEQLILIIAALNETFNKTNQVLWILIHLPSLSKIVFMISVGFTTLVWFIFKWFGWALAVSSHSYKLVFPNIEIRFLLYIPIPLTLISLKSNGLEKILVEMWPKNQNFWQILPLND